MDPLDPPRERSEETRTGGQASDRRRRALLWTGAGLFAAAVVGLEGPRAPSETVPVGGADPAVLRAPLDDGRVPEDEAAAGRAPAPAREPEAPRCRLTGTLADQDERLLRGLELELRECSTAGERAAWRAELAAVEECGPVHRRSQVSAGSFELGGVPPGGWALLVRGRADVPPAAYLFRIEPDQRARHLSLVLPRGLGLHGRVLGPEGEPRPGALVELVELVGLEGQTCAEERAALDGGFAFGPLLPGLYRVEVGGAENLSRPSRLAAAGDGEFLELRQSAAGILRLSIRDESGAPVAARVELRGASGQVAFGSDLRLVRLDPGAYELVARAADGRLAIVQGLWIVDGLAPEPLEVVLRRGLELRLALGGDEARAWRASWGGTLVEEGELAPDEEVTLLVPPGPVQVAWFASARQGGPVLEHIHEQVLAPGSPPAPIRYEPRP